MDSIYIIYDRNTGEISDHVCTLKEAFAKAHDHLKIWEAI